MAINHVNSSIDDRDIKSLATEDTTWFIEIHDETGECQGHIIQLSDKNGIHLGEMHISNPDTVIAEVIYRLIKQCASSPRMKRPRKPFRITFKDSGVARQIPLITDHLGIQSGSAPRTSECMVWRGCYVCSLRGTSDLFQECLACHAVLYCSDHCLLRDSDDHMTSCAFMKLSLDLTHQLQMFPFAYTVETTSPEFTLYRYKQFLQSYGIYDAGYWRRECPKKGISKPYGEILAEDYPYVLPVESSILDTVPHARNEPITDWKTYYNWRGFTLDSPIAVLLTYPMSMYYILSTCIQRDYPEKFIMWNSSSDINVHLLGVTKEVEMSSIFLEVGRLLPRCTLNITMFGKEVSRKRQKWKHKMENVSIEMCCTAYHKHEGVPDIVIGFNSGLGAYRSWYKTIAKIQATHIPAYFTDYCWLSCQRTSTSLKLKGTSEISEPELNPFRSPIRIYCEETNLSWYSNAYLYHLR